MAEAAAQLRARVGKLETELHTKEQERSQAAAEHDRLAEELADQAKKHKAEVWQLQDGEARLKAEFEREKLLSDGYGVIEDMVEGNVLSSLLLSRRLLRGADF